MKSVPLRIDVTNVVGADTTQEIAGTVYFPEALPESGRDVVIFASPGAGYSQHYYNMHFPGHEGYSEAEYHTARGIVFVTMDHLGVGESSLDLAATMSIEDSANANTMFVREVLDRLVKGAISPELRALNNPFAVGMGQSMGGAIFVVMQSTCKTFDALIVLGKSALHTVLPQPTLEQFNLQRAVYRSPRTTPVAQLSAEVFTSVETDFVYPFHWHEEPDDIVEADMGGGYPRRGTPPKFGSATGPAFAIGLTSPGYLASDAACISCPVLITGGERDVMPEVHREPSAYISSSDVSLFIVPRMAHMQNFAPTRRILWKRVADWSQMLAEDEPGVD